MDCRVVLVAFALGASLAGEGCARRNVHAAAPVAVAPVPASATNRPMTTAPDTDAQPPVEPAVAPPAVAAAPAPPTVDIPAATPAPPHRPVQEPVTEAAVERAVHPPAPEISPQLSAGDQASYERKTGEDIAAAEKNLQSARGRRLSAAQQDLFDKIRSFLAQSREASKGGDWARAQNLAQKARLLSAELVSSF